MSMGKRDYAMLRLLWDNALRRAEVCELDRADFHPGEARLYLKGKGKADAISQRDVDQDFNSSKNC